MICLSSFAKHAAYLLHKDMRSLRFIAGIAALLVGVLCFVLPPPLPGWAMMTTASSIGVWGAEFIALGLLRLLVTAQGDDAKWHAWLCWPASLFAVWLWSYVGLSNAMEDADPTLVLVLIPLCIEALGCLQFIACQSARRE